MQSGKLKAFLVFPSQRLEEPTYKPVRLVSTRYEHTSGVLWLYDIGRHEGSFTGLGGVVVDVTPEKKYAIWNHNQHHFAHLHREIDMGDKTTVQLECDALSRLYPAQKYYVVEFEYPGEQD